MACWLLCVGTDILGGATPPSFNAAFSLLGSAVPEPSTWAMMLLGFVGVGFAGYRQSRNGRGVFPPRDCSGGYISRDRRTAVFRLSKAQAERSLRVAF
jgi:hypothetical protein